MTSDPRIVLGQRTDLELERRRGASARAELKAIIRDLERRNTELQDKVEFMLGLADLADSIDRPLPIREQPSERQGLPQATYVMLASDWHMGERVRPETVGHRNEYTPEIAQERAEQFFRSNLTMLHAARSAWHIAQGVLWLGGDLMTGYIHEEYEQENFLSPTEEAQLVFDTLCRGIDFLLRESDLEHLLIPTSNGNHGRTNKKPRIAGAHRNSYEFMLYHLLARTYADEPRVSFQVASGYHNPVDVYGFTIRFHHGDAVRYQGGVGGLTVPLYRRIGRQAQSGQRVDLDCLGHFHQLQFPRGAVINGSLVGWNSYAEHMGLEYEEPMQASFVVDSKYQLVSHCNPILVVPHSRRRAK